MGISFGSINTGLPKDIVKQLMEMERVPIKKMEARKSKFVDKKKLVDEFAKLFNELKVELDKMSSDRGLRELKVETNNGIVDVTLDEENVDVGKHTLEVIRLAQKSSVMTNGFVDREDSYLGVGYLEYYLPDGESKSIYIDSGNSSLDKVASLINRDKRNGITANVINDGLGGDAPWHLIIALDQVGDDNLAEFPYFYFVDGEDDLYIESEREAHDALVKIDGFEVEIPANKTSDLIKGVTIDLKKAVPGEEFTIDVKEDKEAITTKIDDMVQQINNILQFIKKQNKLDQHSDTTRTLGGDITLQTIESKIRSVIFQPIKTQFGQMRFGDMGVTFQKNGLLEMDLKRFENMVQGRYSIVTQVLVGSTDAEGVRHSGFLRNFKKVVDGIISYNGILSTRRNGIKNKIAQIDKQIERRERLIARRETMLKDKFARLEGTIARIRNQGAGLAALGVNNTNIVQQLG